MRERTASGPIACAVALAGVVLLMVAFVLPWWSMTVTPPTDKSSRTRMSSSYDIERTMEKNATKLVKHVGWYVAHSNIVDVDEIMAMKEAPTSLTWRVWGWHCGTGIAILVLGIVAAAVLCSMLGSGFLRRWAWIGLLVTATMGIAAFVLALVWIITCPGENIEPVLSEGVHVGAFVALAGGLVLMVCGLIGGIIGLNLLAKRSAAAAA
jgi:hypothetical protein